MIVGTAVSVASMVLLMDGSGSLRYIVAAGLFNFAWNFTFPYQMGLLSTLDTTGSIAVPSLVAQLLGLSLGPALASLLLSGRGYDGVLWACIGCYLASVPLVLGERQALSGQPPSGSSRHDPARLRRLRRRRALAAHSSRRVHASRDARCRLRADRPAQRPPQCIRRARAGGRLRSGGSVRNRATRRRAGCHEGLRRIRARHDPQFRLRLADGMRIEHDDELVTRYRAAGLVPMGTTNVPELSSSLSTESKRHGPCRNPWNPCTRSVARAAVPQRRSRLASFRSPTGMIQRVRSGYPRPAAACSAFGRAADACRPDTVYGEIWYGLLSHHVITRSVRDSALVLDLTAGVDHGAPYGAPAGERSYFESLQHGAAATADRGRRRHAPARGAARRLFCRARGHLQPAPRTGSRGHSRRPGLRRARAQRSRRDAAQRRARGGTAGDCRGNEARDRPRNRRVVSARTRRTWCRGDRTRAVARAPLSHGSRPVRSAASSPNTTCC